MTKEEVLEMSALEAGKKIKEGILTSEGITRIFLEKIKAES